MKILHINNVASVAESLVAGLRKLGVDAHLYQPYTGVDNFGKLGKFKVGLNRLLDVRTLAANVKKEAYDIVHIHYAYFGMLAVLGDYPYWLHCHGTDIRRNLYHPAFRKITQISLKHAERVLYATPDLKAHAERHRPDASLLLNPVRIDLFKPRSPGGSTGKILLISRIDKIKGISTAFNALEKLKNEYPDLEIDAFAWGPDFESFKNKQFINFIPKTSHRGMAELIPDYQVIIGQFRLGILGMSEMESMACAKPVVCRFDYHNLYLEAPPIVRADGEDEIVSKVEKLLASPKLCKEIGEAGRDWVVKYHGYISVAERLARDYESACY